MKLSVSEKLAFIREYKKQGGKGNYLSAIKQYEFGGEKDKISTSIPYQAPTNEQVWQSTIPKQPAPTPGLTTYNKSTDTYTYPYSLEGPTVTNKSNPSNININYKPITGEFFIPPKDKPIYQPERDNTNVQRENPVERQYKIDKAKQRQNDGEVKQAPDESFVKKIYREAVPEYIQRNLETGAEMTNKFNNRMLQPSMALATIPMGIGITSAAFNSMRAKKMYDIAAAAGDVVGMTKWSQLGTNAVNTGVNTSGSLAQLEKSALNNASDLLQFDYINMLQRPLLKTAIKYGLNGNKLSIGYGTATTGNAVRNINQSVNEHKFGGEITQSIPYQAPTSAQVWQSTIPELTYKGGMLSGPSVIGKPGVNAPNPLVIYKGAVQDSNIPSKIGVGTINALKAAELQGTVGMTTEDDDYIYNTDINPISLSKDKLVLPSNKEENREQIKALQADMVSKGYYTPALDVSQPLTKDQVKEIQKKLVKSKYNINETNEINGVLDESTQRAIKEYNYNREVDGIVGKRTKNAFNKYKQEYIPINDYGVTNEKDAVVKQGKYITNIGTKTGKTVKFTTEPFKTNTESKTDLPECTLYVNSRIKQALPGINTDDYGIYGDAWTIGDNILSKGGTEVYKANYQIPAEYDINTIKQNISQSINSNKPNIKNIQAGQYVELYNPTSNNFKKAYDEGNGTMTTHVGIITKGDDNKLYVEHNVHGRVYKEPLETVINRKDGIRITRIVEPKFVKEKPIETEDYYIDAENLGIKFNKKSKGRNIADKNAYLFQKTLTVNKPIIKKNFGIDDEDFKIINEVAYGVAANETYFGKAAGYQLKNNPTAALFDVNKALQQDSPKEIVQAGVTYSKAGRAMKDLQEKMGKGDASRGWGQVKETDLFGKDYVEKSGISQAKENSPEYGALTTVSSIASKYKVLSSLIAREGVKVALPEFKSLLAISHNQGFANIEKDIQNYKRTGDYKYIKQYNDMSYPTGVRRYSQEYVTFK